MFFFLTFALFFVQLISFRSKQLSRRFQDVNSHGQLYCFIFQAPKKVGKDEFSDILNAQGFKTTGDPEGEAQTLKALKKEQNKPLDPIRAKVTFPLLIFFLFVVIIYYGNCDCGGSNCNVRNYDYLLKLICQTSLKKLKLSLWTKCWRFTGDGDLNPTVNQDNGRFQVPSIRGKHIC